MKVKSAFIAYGNARHWQKVGDYRQLKENLIVKIFTDKGNFDIVLRKDFFCDGLSVPKAFQFFLPSWDDNNSLYNLAGCIHDYLYAVKGCTKVITLTREECDDVFRGLLRCAGISRFKAGVADKCVEIFAGNKKHFGNDPFNLKLHCDWYIST